jgi:hypothetical protein
MTARKCWIDHTVNFLGIIFVAWLSLGGARTRGDESTPGAPVTVIPESFALTGPRDGRQLLVSTRGKDGREQDLTRGAHYRVEPPGVAEADVHGYVRAVGEGSATIIVAAAGRVILARVEVRDCKKAPPVHFSHDVVPLLTRYGCNAGGCHGKASGQNGFKLSLFGFDPSFDFDAIAREGRGRRVFPAAPDASLILLKPAGRLPHGGGKLFEPGSETYHTLRTWIVQGMPRGNADAPTLKALEVLPRKRSLDRRAKQQIAVLARYSDGSARDVTRLAQYQSNEAVVAAVESDGLVRTADSAGQAAIMARYSGLVATFKVTVPLAASGAAAFHFPESNYIDKLAAAAWRALGLVPSGLCTESEFLRRLSLDTRGKLPTLDETRAFVADGRADKRARLIDQFLEGPDYAAFFALRYSAILRNSTTQGGSEAAAYAFHAWLRDMFARNRPYDELVRGIVTASGQWQDAPAVNWYWQMSEDPLHQPVGDTAQIFLGLRLQCARCHHHPYERWGQDDYFGLAGFFAKLTRKDFDGEPVFFAGRALATSEANPRTGKPLEPKLLDGEVLKIPPEEDPRHQLVDWMVGPENPFFAKAFCNRTWGHLMGRGLVEPVDDLRETNPPSNPELLDALAADFRAHKFDIKHLIKTIASSRTYQLSALPNQTNAHDQQSFSRYYARRLPAEVLLDAVDSVCGTETAFDKVQKKSRAVDLPHNGFSSYFLDIFNRPARTSACECARVRGSASLSQVLHLANSPEIEDKIAAESGRIARLAKEKAPFAQAVGELYLVALSRAPTASEQQAAEACRKSRENPRRALEDLMWALLNSREFVFNH